MLQHPDDGGMRDVAPLFCFTSYIKTRMLQQHLVFPSCEQFEASRSTRAAVINMTIDHQAAASTMSLFSTSTSGCTERPHLERTHHLLLPVTTLHLSGRVLH